MVLPAEYSTVLALCLSPDGKRLVTAEEQGTLAIFDLNKVLDRAADKEPSKVFKTNHNVLSLITTQQDLILGSSGVVSGYRWSDLNLSKPSEAWSIVLETKKGSPFETDANALALRPNVGTAGELVVGGGDGRLHCFDIETSQATAKPVEAHKDFIHDLSLCNESGLLASASEDGEVTLWSPTNWQSTNTLSPDTCDELRRPNLGKWIGAVSLRAGWMAVGGGPRASIWHPQMLRKPSHLLPPEQAAVHALDMQDEHVVIGGATNKLYRTNLMGDPLSETSVSSSCVYTTVCQEKPVRFLAAAGASNYIDICAPNFAYGFLRLQVPSLK